MSKRAPKGTPTALNISTLADLVVTNRGAASMRNQIESTSVAGIRRCLKFGWVIVNADSTLSITTEAKAIVVRYLESEMVRYSQPAWLNDARANVQRKAIDETLTVMKAA